MNIIEEIMSEVFPGDYTSAYKARFDLLYELVFEVADPGQHEQLKAEIIACEKDYADNTRQRYAEYANMSAQLIIETYSGVAFWMAEKRYMEKRPFIAARYMKMVFMQLIEDPYMKETVKGSMARKVSETIMDFNFASGATDNMSFRLHNMFF